MHTSPVETLRIAGTGALVLCVAAWGCDWVGSGTPAPAPVAIAAQPQAGPAPGAGLGDSVPVSGKVRANRLAGETSPYLLMHAHNPVDWYPWGEEALAKAKRENKLIFLSVGYSSCYWCHRMERDVFMNDELAAYLNEHFVCIKVDREERPDVDDVYMTALQIYNQLTGQGGGGGWPMSMFLTPDARPFAGGTYFPADTFLSLLMKVQETWSSQAENVDKMGTVLADLVDRSMRERNLGERVELRPEILEKVREAIRESYDPTFGGFGYSEANDRQPKFPDPGNLSFLVDRARLHGDAEARRMLVFTLERMAQGGIHDHLGGGFHRYSTDRYWSVPHFEKMLYDQAQLASIYAETFAMTGDFLHRRVLEGMLEFVRRELTDPLGGFYSALDAETNEEEGRFYVWTAHELRDLLPPQEFELLAKVYAIGDQPQMDDFYVLQGTRPIADVAAEMGMTPQALLEKIAPVQARLMEARSKRTRPLTDTKILTAWNGLMIRGFADAGRLLGEEEYVDTAAKAAEFVLGNLRTPQGRLLRTSTGGKARLNAYLDDYAFLVHGLLGLHEATGQGRWLEEADRLMAKQIELHWDPQHPGFYYTSNDHERLIARGKNPVDTATPSENAVSAMNLLYLAEHLERADYREKARTMLQEFSPMFTQSPGAVPRLALALSRWLEVKEKFKVSQ